MKKKLNDRRHKTRYIDKRQDAKRKEKTKDRDKTNNNNK